VAAKDDKKDAAQPGFNPKAVQLGGESLIERLIPHMKKIAIALVIAAAILTVIFTVRHFRERGREKATDKLASVLDVADRDVRGSDAPPPDPKDPKAKEPTFTSNKERASAVLDSIGKGAKAPGPYRASMLMQAGKLDEAIAEYRKHQIGKTLDAVLAREGLGIALETKATQQKDAAARQKGLEEALTVFQQMQPDDKGPRHAYALYHQGRILAMLGKTGEAKAMFEKAKEGDKDERFTNLIDERIASLGAS
jgi:tetratricopeptide (TPR) repeat protein